MPNSTSIATPVPCQQCGKLLISKRNLRRHEQKVHKILPTLLLKLFAMSVSKFSRARRKPKAQEHVELAHGIFSNCHCIWCHTLFLTAESYQKQLLKKHTLPVWDGVETSFSFVPTESKFREKLRQYDLKIGEKEIDLLKS